MKLSMIAFSDLNLGLLKAVHFRWKTHVNYARNTLG